MPRDFDPSKPLIGSDLLEYEDFAARLVGTPRKNYRNDRILNIRAYGYPGDDVAFAKYLDRIDEDYPAR